MCTSVVLAVEVDTGAPAGQHWVHEYISDEEIRGNNGPISHS